MDRAVPWSLLMAKRMFHCFRLQLHYRVMEIGVNLRVVVRSGRSPLASRAKFVYICSREPETSSRRTGIGRRDRGYKIDALRFFSIIKRHRRTRHSPLNTALARTSFVQRLNRNRRPSIFVELILDPRPLSAELLGAHLYEPNCTNASLQTNF